MVDLATQTPCLVEISSHSPAGPSKLDSHVERLVVDVVLGWQASLRGRLPYITSSLHNISKLVSTKQGVWVARSTIIRLLHVLDDLNEQQL